MAVEEYEGSTQFQLSLLGWLVAGSWMVERMVDVERWEHSDKSIVVAPCSRMEELLERRPLCVVVG